MTKSAEALLDRLQRYPSAQKLIIDNSGFEFIGTLRAVGFKFGRWADTVLMQCGVGSGHRELPGK